MLNKSLSFLTIIYILAVVFAPPLSGAIGESVRYDDIVLIGLFILVLISRHELLFERVQQLPAIRSLFTIMYLLVFAIFISWLINDMFGNGISNNQSIKEILRVTKYALVIIVGIGLGYQDQKQVLFVLVWAGLITVCIQLFQFFGGTRFNELLISIYGSEIFYSSAISISQREMGAFSAGATFANKNVAAAFLLIPFAISFGALLANMKANSTNAAAGFATSSHWMSKMAFVPPTLCAMGLILAGSRAGLIASGTVILGQIVLHRLTPKQTLRLVLYTGLLAAVSLYLLFITGTTVFSRFEQGIFDSRGSLNIKMQLFTAVVESMSFGHLMFGYGAGGGVGTDFEYGYFIVWYGLLGLGILVFLWITFISSLWRNWEHYYDWITPFSLVLGYMAMNWSQTTFLSIRAFPLFLFAFFAYVRWQCDSLPVYTSLGRKYSTLLSKRGYSNV